MSIPKISLSMNEIVIYFSKTSAWGTEDGVPQQGLRPGLLMGERFWSREREMKPLLESGC